MNEVNAHSSTLPNLGDKHTQTSSITHLDLWPHFPFNTTLHLMRWEDSSRPFFQPEFLGLFPLWRLRAQPVDHGKAINAADNFVTMYKQRTQISSMSNHIHSLIPCWALSGCTQTRF